MTNCLRWLYIQYILCCRKTTRRRRRRSDGFQSCEENYEDDCRQFNWRLYCSI